MKEYEVCFVHVGSYARHSAVWLRVSAAGVLSFGGSEGRVVILGILRLTLLFDVAMLSVAFLRVCRGAGALAADAQETRALVPRSATSSCLSINA